MSDAEPTIVPIRMKRPKDNPPGAIPGHGFWCYSGSGALNAGGKVWRQWIPIIYED